MMRAGFFALLLSVAAVAQGADSLRIDIDRGNREWLDGMKVRNAELMARAYAPDAVNCNPKGECLNGHDAIEKYFATRVAAMKSNVTGGSVTSKKIVRDGEFAYEWGSAVVTFADGKTFGGRYLTVWRHDADGKWRIIRNLAL